MFKKFADNTKLGQEMRTQEDKEKLQRALDGLVTWAETWGMEFNVAKCKVMHVGPRNPGHVYSMAGKDLEVTEEEKDIGTMEEEKKERGSKEEEEKKEEQRKKKRRNEEQKKKKIRKEE